MPDAPLPTTAGVRVLDHAVVRVAAWPIEVADPFAAPDLAAAARQLTATAAGDDSDLAEAIHDAVPAVTDAPERRWLLAVRRALPDPEATLPAPPVTGVGETEPDLVARIDAARAARAEGAAARAAFAAAHADELTRQRLALRELAGSDRFRAALALAEPTALVRWDAARDKPLSDKSRVRRLEATVFSFAMRACGRPTPNGGWSGVAPVVPETAVGHERAVGDLLSVGPGRRGAHVSVDLAPFAAVLAAWAAARGAAPDHLLQREPTLRDEDGADGHRWVYLRRDTEPCTFAALSTVPVLREAIAGWPRGSVATPGRLYEELGERQGRAVVEHLLAVGVLHSAFRLPDVAATPADALRSVVPLLPTDLADPWCAALDAVGAACAALEEAFLDDDVAAVVRHRDEVVAATSVLTESAGLGPTPTDGLVHLDLRVPWSVTWRAGDRLAVTSALDVAFAVHAADGSAEAYRHTMAARVGEALEAGAALLPATETLGATPPAGDDVVLAGVASTSATWTGPQPLVATRGELLRSVGIDAEPAEEEWRRLFAPHAMLGRRRVRIADPASDRIRVRVDAPDASREGGSWISVSPPDNRGFRSIAGGPPPRPGEAGSFVVALSGADVWLRWGRPQPGMFVSRFAALLGDGSTEGADRVVAGVDRALGGLPARRVLGADAPNRNAALRPNLAGVGTWGWSLAPGGHPPASATPVVEPDRVVLVDADTGARFVPVYDSAAVIGGTDPVTRFVRTAAMAGGWELAAWGIPVLAPELDGWPCLPRLELSGRPHSEQRLVAGVAPPMTVERAVDRASAGVLVDPATVVGARRWIVGGDLLIALRDEPDEARRYLRWRAELDRRDVPGAVLARVALRPDAPELLLLTESPLALRALCERLPDDAVLVLTELPGPRTTWPIRDGSSHHLSELAVTWVRRRDDVDPAVFPGGVVPPSFLAALDALRDVAPPSASSAGGAAAVVAAQVVAVLDELVDPDDRAAVARDAADWLTRVAEAQDPGGAGEAAPIAAAADPESAARRRVELASLLPAFDDEVGLVATAASVDPLLVRTQLLARLVHIDAVGRWGAGPDRLRAEAAVWRAAAEALAGSDDER